MVTLSVALEDMKTQLVEAVRGAVEKGFELVAGVVGTKLAKAMEGAVQNAELVGGKKGGGYGYADLAGLREQIMDNASVLLPMMTARSSSSSTTTTTTISRFPHLRILTTGTPTSGMRALLCDDSRPAKPKLLFWSHKHATVSGALKDLLENTQSLLKPHLAAIVNLPSPAVGTGGGFWNNAPFPSFNTPSPDGSAAANAGASNWDGSGKGSPLLWDAGMTTNPSFHQAGGFDYGSFDTVDGGFDSDDATCVDAGMYFSS